MKLLFMNPPLLGLYMGLLHYKERYTTKKGASVSVLFALFNCSLSRVNVYSIYKKKKKKKKKKKRKLHVLLNNWSRC